MVLVTIWPSRDMMIHIVNSFTSFSDLYSDIPEQLCVRGSLVSDTVHLDVVLCRDYENGYGDHMAIKGHDDSYSVFIHFFL